MEINLDDIRTIFEKLIKHLEKIGVNTVSIPVDYYWNIPNDVVYDPYNEPTKFDMGQLSDDWRELQKLLDDDREPVGYHLVWLAAVLKAIGEFTIG